MKIHNLIFVKFAVIIVAFVVVISGIYVWLLPEFFQGYKTYSFLVVSIICSAVLSGYYGYVGFKIEPVIYRLVASFVCAAIVAFVIAFLSLLIIANLRGV